MGHGGLLSAMVGGRARAVMAVVSTGVEDLSGEIQQSLADADPQTNPFGTETQGDPDAVTGETD